LSSNQNGSKELAVREDKAKVQVLPGFGSLQSFELIQRAATLLSKSSLVPKEYQGNLPNCVIALNMANRLQADPLMVMQNLYIVHGKPGWSSQFLISTFNACGRFTALRYEWSGKQGSDDWGCKAWAIEKETGQKLEGSTITIGMAKEEGWYSKNGSKWKTMPQQMLMYRAASWFIRAYAPELAMGIYTEDEIIDIEDAEVITVENEIKEKANKEFVDIGDDPGEQDPEQKKDEKPKADQKQQGMFGGDNGPEF
jgi:hypothetical protein